MTPIVQVVLPFHNASATLPAAIESIARQTFSQWQLVLVDNASTDNGPAVARAWCQRDARVVLLQEPRRGIAHALNTGLAYGRAPLVARMDADDVSLPQRLMQQVDHMQRHEEIGVLATRVRYATALQQSEGMQHFVRWQNELIAPAELYVKRFVDVPVAHPTVIFRRVLVEQYGAYTTDAVPEDHELWLRWMHHGVRFAKLPQELLVWNDHADRLSRTHRHYATAAFDRLKSTWLATWLAEHLNGRALIVAGTSILCLERAALLQAQGITIDAYTDVRHRTVPPDRFVLPEALPNEGKAFVISFISQRGTGARIAAFLAGRGMVEGRDFLLAA
jgi:glycosyltransferase involved in cell wall biosynthesis